MEELTHDFLSFLPAALLALAAAGAPEVYKLAARRFLERAKSHMASWLYILLDSFLTPVAGLFRVLLGAAAVKSLPFELVRGAVFLQYLNLAADLLVIFYLFPIPAMAIMLAGSSSGSPYGGIGFSREMIMMLAYEIPLLMIMLTVAMKVGGGSGAEFSLTKIMDYQAEHGSFGLTPVMWPAFLAWLMFLPATLGVPPFDQPEAETEILEGPLLEYSGVLLAFFHMASALKMVVALALGVVLFFPGTISDIPAVNLVWFVVKCALFMLFALTVVKSATGRLRIEQALSFFLKYPAGLALLSLILVWIGC